MPVTSDVPVMEKKAEPDTTEYVKESPSGSVAATVYMDVLSPMSSAMDTEVDPADTGDVSVGAVPEPVMEIGFVYYLL